MKKQLITISPDGSMTGLQFKRGQGLDLRQFGPAKIERSSLVEWDELYQKWFIKFLNGERSGTTYTKTDFHQYKVPPLHSTVHPETGTMLFTDYEDAVTVEVAFIQAYRVAHGPDSI